MTDNIQLSDAPRLDQADFHAVLLNGIRDAVIGADRDGVIRYWGCGASDLLGYTSEEMLHARLDVLIDVKDGLEQARQEGQWRSELRLADKSGRAMTVEASVSAVADDSDERLGFVAILREVPERGTEAKHAPDHNRHHHAIACLSRIALGDIDLQGLLDSAVESLSKALDVPLCQVLELEPGGKTLLLRAGVGWNEGLIGKARISSGELSHAGFTLAAAKPVIMDDLRTETRFIAPAMLHDSGAVSGLTIVIHGLNNQPFGILGIYTKVRRSFGDNDINYLQCVANLLTESIRRRYMDGTLRHSEQRFRDLYRALRDSKTEVHRHYEQINAIYSTAPIGLCYLDSDLRIINMNDHLRAMLEYDDIDPSGRRLHEAAGHAAASLEQICRDALLQRAPILNKEIMWQRGDSGDECYSICSCYPIAEVDGRLVGVHTVVLDITDRKRGELELARMASIVANSYDAIIGKTLDGRITSWNQGAERVFGYSAEEVIGQSINIIVPEDRRREELDILTALRSGKHVSFDETVRIRKDGSSVRVSLTVSPIRNSVGEAVGASTIVRDLTASKLAEQAVRENEAHMRLILKAARVGIWDWEMASGKMRWSKNMDELHGKKPGSFQGTFSNAMEYVHPDDRATIEEAIAAAESGDGEYHSEYRVVAHDGRIIWIESKGQILRDTVGGPKRMAGVCMDITERRVADEALRINETMLRTQTEELATAHRQKDEFLAMLAHELRNPLAPISNAVQLLKIQDKAQHEKTLPWAIDVIDRQVVLISRLVDDLLDVARITRGHIELQTELVDLRSLIDQVVRSASAWFDAKQQHFEVYYPEQPIIVDADTTRMVQAVTNILNNASKFTSQFGTITLRVYCQSDEAVIAVADNGIGISADMLPHVFELFTQADRSLDRRQGGLGLGLSLVRKMVEMHGGHVLANSPGMGRGSEFFIHLPLAAAPANVAARISHHDKPQCPEVARSLRVLVVDDNAQSTDAMAMLMKNLGHTVRTAYSGPEALMVAGDFLPDIVFLDIGLPLMDGYEVAKKLRARFGSGTNLIALTGYAPQQGGRWPAPVDFDQYILKPVSLDKLMSLLVAGAPATD
jgi:two-component system CheB/CheR fusion protein